MSHQHWLMKSEPSKYSFAQLVRDGRTMWDGVRNFEARNFMRAMREGDLVLFYHSNDGKSVVGVARVAREAYPDPTSEGEDWSAVDIEPVVAFKVAVSLDTIRSDPALLDIALLKRSRLSVVPVTEAHFERILELGKTKISQRKRAQKAPASPARAPRATRA
jgi:predicted RNA-binding protein with PUA-like domain